MGKGGRGGRAGHWRESGPNYGVQYSTPLYEHAIDMDHVQWIGFKSMIDLVRVVRYIVRGTSTHPMSLLRVS